MRVENGSAVDAVIASFVCACVVNPQSCGMRGQPFGYNL